MIANDVKRFLKQFETTLTVLAREGRHVELKARFEDFNKVLGAWIEVAPPGAAPPERLRFLPVTESFCGSFEIDMYAIALAATLSGDSSTVVVVADQLIHGALECLQRDQPRLMEELLNTLSFLYHQCFKCESLANAVGARLDSGLHSLVMRVRGAHSDVDGGRADKPIDMTALIVVLRFALTSIRTAIHHEQRQHAKYFVERVFEHRKHRSPRLGRASGSVTMSAEVLFDYVAVVLTGWALHILQNDVLKKTDAAEVVLGAALTQLPAVPVLVAEWELLRGAESHDAAIDNRLGIGLWDDRDWDQEFRVGVCETRFGESDWVRLGLRAALLRTSAHFFVDESHLFAAQPRRFIWDATKEQEALQSLAADRWIDIPEDQRWQRVASVMQTIGKRARGADAEYLRYVLESPLSEARVARLREDATKAFALKRSWQNALRQAGLCKEQVQSYPLPTRWGIWVPRECLLDDNNWVSDFGEHLGNGTATREAMALIHLIETAAPRGAELRALATLPESLRDAKRTMSDAGFNPNVIILPREDRFAGALFQKPLWQVEGRYEFSEASIGVWEQMLVLRFPYTNPKSILVLDTRRLIAECEYGDGNPADSVWIEEHPQNQEMEAKKAATTAALSSADSPIPDSNSIQVLAWMETSPRIGLVDVGAAVAIDIRDSDGGYAIVRGSKMYHRPSCVGIETQDVTYVLRIEPGDGRTPCPTCRPEQ